MSGNWEKRRVETFESLGSIARPSFVVENGQPGAQQVGGEPIPAPPSTAPVSPTIELDPERIAAQKRADREP